MSLAVRGPIGPLTTLSMTKQVLELGSKVYATSCGQHVKPHRLVCFVFTQAGRLLTRDPHVRFPQTLAKLIVHLGGIQRGMGRLLSQPKVSGT